MMKSVCAFTRKEGLTRQQFHDYYENNHAPLGIQHFPFARYVRNHVQGSPEIDIETISEFWAEDIGALAGLMDGPVGEIMAVDEARFMQRDRIAPGGADEAVLSEGDATDKDGFRSVFLVRWTEGNDAAALQDLKAWAKEVAAQQPGVSLDVITSWSADSGFPAKALLWLPDHARAPRPAASFDVTPLRVRRCETPLEDMLPYRKAQA